MTALDSIGLISTLFQTLNKNQFFPSEIKVKLINPCTDKIFIKIFKSQEDFMNYITRFRTMDGCISIDYMLLESITVNNNNLVKLGHIFYAYNLGDPNNILLNQKGLFNKYSLNSNDKSYQGYTNHLLNLLKVYAFQRSTIVIPREDDLYVECCYVDDDYVD